ncbi:MAG TPA: VWA domain-containing protein [Candidatus Dormibacteraeota bacterium]|nr:VWA domain-containing protein [Candidatus Dormibacteraeota bacterium]
MPGTPGWRADPRDVEGSCVRFARLLRARGVRVGPDQAARWLRSLALLTCRRPQDLYWSGRANLLTSPAQFETYDALFRSFWITLDHPALDANDARETRGVPQGEQRRAASSELEPGENAASRRPGGESAAPGRGLPGMEAWARTQTAHEHGGTSEDARDEQESEAARGLYSPLEMLREKDFAAFTPADAAALRGLLERDAWWEARMASRRTRPAPRGRRLDLRATLASSARTGGDPLSVRRRSRRTAWRKWIFLCDVSASMAPYTEGLLQSLHVVAARRPRTEVFLFGTRLTRVTPQLRRCRSQDVGAYVAGVRDWHGGTRLGGALEGFLRQYGRRGMAHGAVVFVLSDGLDQGEAGHVEAAMRSLARLAHRIVWINPLKKSPRYEPLARGMAEALPYVSDFASGHSLGALSEVLARTSRLDAPGAILRRAR